MLKPKILRAILDELGISFGTAFNIEGEKTPYRFKKDGGIERFIGQTWIDSSYSYLDLVNLIDSNRVSIYKGTLVEYSPVPKEKTKKKKVDKSSNV